MHRDHDHRHDPHDHHPDSAGGPAAPAGHNRPAAQWQTPHVAGTAPSRPAVAPSEPDLDLVEDAFVEAFATASDPTSFLRLAKIGFEGLAPDGTKLALLRVEVEQVADVGSVTPHFGGGFGYDPLPARLVSRRRRLRFVYFDGSGPRVLGLAAATALHPVPATAGV